MSPFPEQTPVLSPEDQALVIEACEQAVERHIAQIQAEIDAGHIEIARELESALRSEALAGISEGHPDPMRLARQVMAAHARWPELDQWTQADAEGARHVG